MRKRKAALAPFLAVLAALAIGGAAAVQQPTPLPFDNTLSIYVGHNGTWMNYTTQQNEAAEIEDPVAAFEPEEQISDDPDTWGVHQINDPQPPQGWTFFAPSEGPPMYLHVIVRDTQSRLDHLVITDRDTGQYVGTLPANAQHSEIDGAVQVDPTREAFNIQVQGQNSTTLFKAGANNAKIDDAIACTRGYGFDPNRGEEHMCPMVADLGPYWGNPESVVGKESTGGPAVNRSACAGNLDFTNDNQNAIATTAKYPLLDKKIVEDTTNEWEGAGLPPQATQGVVAAITAARQPYQGGVDALQMYTRPPFSRGTAHWPATVIGEIRSILYFPYRGRQVNKADVAVRLEGKVTEKYEFGVGTHNPAGELVLAITLGAQEKRYFQCGDPVEVGNVWGLRVTTPGPPDAMPLENITAPVTVNLNGDITGPTGGQGPIGGTGQAIKRDHWTITAPPLPMPPQLALDFDNPQVGTCVVNLGKGWKWRFEANPQPHYSTPNPVDDVQISGPWTVNFLAHLQVCMNFVVNTVDGQGQPTPATVVVDQRIQTNPEMWQELSRGDSQQVNGQGPFVYSVGLVPKDTYLRAAALNPMGLEPGTYQYYLVAPCLEHTVTCTVPEGMMGGGGGEP